jgi:hypothetical protein
MDKIAYTGETTIRRVKCVVFYSPDGGYIYIMNDSMFMYTLYTLHDTLGQVLLLALY